MTEQPSLAELAEELAAIDPYLSEPEALALVEAQVDVAGFPEAGPGMAAAHEWSDRQMAILERHSCDICQHPVKSGTDHGFGLVLQGVCGQCPVCLA